MNRQSRLFSGLPRRPRPASVSTLALLVSLLLTGSGCDGRSPAPEVIPLPVADDDRLSLLQRVAIDRLLDLRVATGGRAGFVALIARGSEIIYARTTGWADIEAAVPMALDTRFHIASMTKPITAVAALILVDEGRISLDDPIANYLPEFGAPKIIRERNENGTWTTKPSERPILIRHLLSMSSGIGGYAETEDALDRFWRSPDIELAGLGSLADRISLIPKLPLYEEPGQRWRYGWSLDVMARIVEVVAQIPYEQFLESRIFEPLGMSATSYAHAVPEGATLAKMYTHAEDGSLVREHQFEDAYGRGWGSGGGGLVSTAPDYMRFALMLHNQGEWNGIRILSRDLARDMTRLHLSSGVLDEEGIEGLGWGLGLCVVADADLAIMPVHNGDYWWSGRFGTHFIVSPSQDMIVVVMQQTESGPYSDLAMTPALVQGIAMP